MPNQNSFFTKPLLKFLSIALAFAALTVSIIFSQNNSQNKKDKKKDPPTIYNSSKSGLPHFPKEEKPETSKEPSPAKEQTNNAPKQESKPNEQKQNSKKNNVESKTEEKKKSPIMPSSKAPDPGPY